MAYHQGQMSPQGKSMEKDTLSKLFQEKTGIVIFVVIKLDFKQNKYKEMGKDTIY